MYGAQLGAFTHRSTTFPQVSRRTRSLPSQAVVGRGEHDGAGAGAGDGAGLGAGAGAGDGAGAGGGLHGGGLHGAGLHAYCQPVACHPLQVGPLANPQGHVGGGLVGFSWLMVPLRSSAAIVMMMGRSVMLGSILAASSTGMTALRYWRPLASLLAISRMVGSEGSLSGLGRKLGLSLTTT